MTHQTDKHFWDRFVKNFELLIINRFLSMNLLVNFAKADRIATAKQNPKFRNFSDDNLANIPRRGKVKKVEISRTQRVCQSQSCRFLRGF
jgi:hypothetical protein